MTNYFKWQRRKILTTSLRLDAENPRLTEFGRKPTQPEIIDYLIQHEKVYELARSIILQGYFLNELPITAKEDDKFVVLEGNRRVAACKILINPDLVKSQTKRSALKKALIDFDVDTIKKLEVVVSPSREEADVMIVNRHTGGSVVEKWDKTKQDRFLYNRFIAGESIEEMAAKFSFTKGYVKEALQRYNVFLAILKLDIDEKTKGVLEEEVKFSMTNLERFYNSKSGREFLGIDFTETGTLIKKLPVSEFESRMKAIVTKVVNNDINSRTLNTDEQRRKFVEELFQSGQFDNSVEPDEKYNSLHEVPEETEEEVLSVKVVKPKVKKSVASNKLFADNLHFESGIKRIDDIFLEIKGLNLKSNPNAIAILLRSYLDMVTYQFLKYHNGIAEIIKLEGEKLKAENDKMRESLRKFIQELGIEEDMVSGTKIDKLLKLKGGVNRDFIPSLRFMLDFLSGSDLITEVKLKVALKSYLNKNSNIDKVIGHNEFNLLVHNEYYTSDIIELQTAWGKIEPIIQYMITNFKKNND